MLLKNLPSTKTPRNAENLTLGIRYLTATAGANGDFYVDIDGADGLEANDIVRILFPAATDDTANARLSIDGASGTYYNVATKLGTTIKAQNIEEKNLELIYDGVKFRAAIQSGAFIELASNYELSDNTLTNIPYTILKYDTDGFYNPAEPTKFTIPAGVKVVRVGGMFDWAINANGRREMVIRKNSGASFPSAAAVLPVDTVRTTVPIVSPPVRVEEGDFFEMRVRQTSGGSLNLDNDFNRNNFYIEVIE